MITLRDVEAMEERVVAGLMTGTSMDGLDVAICSIRPGDRLTFDLLAFDTVAMPDDVRRAMAPEALTGVREVARLNQALGLFFADALLEVVTPLGVQPHLIGSHGQTVYHEHGQTTLQLGEPGVMAARFGCPVVHDFRMNDIAVGGSGAPLVPYVDQRLLGDRGEAILAINIGGIANLTALPADADGPSAVIGMDCGPGNMVMDGLAARWSEGRLQADLDGALAMDGQVDQALLARLKEHPYFATPPPRSTGREQFGEAFLEEMLGGVDLHRGNGQTVRHLMATLAALTVWGIADTYRRFVEPALHVGRGPVDRVIVSGGGSRNPVLMAGLRSSFPGVPVEPSDMLGLPVDAKEAIAFAILASDRVDRRPANLPSVTGAGRRVLLGKLTEC